MKARLISVLLVIALLVTVGVVAAQAAVSPHPGAHASAYTVCDEAAKMNFGTSGGNVTMDCPACLEKNVTWVPLSDSTWATAKGNYHYYVPAGNSLEGRTKAFAISVGDSKNPVNICIHLNGQTISSDGANTFQLTGGTSLSVRFMGEGNVTASSGNHAIYTQCGWLGLFGGTYSNGGNSATVPTIYNYGTFTRRVFIYNGATVNGTLATKEGNFGSVHFLGGNVLKAVLPTENSSTGNMYTWELEKDPVIGELDLTGTRTIKVGTLTQGASITVKAEGAFTDAFASVDAMNAALPYFHAAEENYDIVANAETRKLECVLTQATGELLDPMDEKFNDALDFVEGTTEANCPHCGEVIVWDELTAGETLVAGTHYYLKENLTLTAPFAAPDGTDVETTIHLNGHNITSASTAVFTISNTAAPLNIMGNGTVSGGGTSEAATIVAKPNVEFNLYGGTYTHTGTMPTLIMARAQGQLNMYQANFVGTDKATGSHIYLKFGHIVMNGGSITGGVATDLTNKLGGNVAVMGYITGTTRVQHSFTMNGGTIDGDMYITEVNSNDAHKVTISGTAKINNTKGGLTTDGRDIIFKDLADTAKIYVTGPHLEAIATADVPGDIGTKVLAAEEFASIKYYNEEIVISGANDYKELAEAITDFTTANCPVCGDGAKWETLGEELVSGGHYYISADLTLDAPLAVAEGTVCIHLNGKTVTSAGAVASIAKGATLNVMGSGTVTGKGTSDASVIYTKGSVNLYGGTYSHVDTAVDSLVIDGGTATMADGVTFTSTRVTDENGNATDGTVYGRNVWLKSGKFNMLGGIIENGTVVQNGTDSYQGGGNIRMNNGTLNVTGGIIRNGYANISGTHGGGNILAYRGILKLHDVEISGGKAVGGQGGNILSVMAGIDIDGAEIKDGYAKDGGNMIIRNPQSAGVNGENRIYRTKITNGQATDSAGNLSYLGTTHEDKPVLKIYECEITDGKAASKGGNFYIAPSATCQTYILGVTKITGGEAYDGANVFVAGRGTVELISAEINKGTATHGALAYIGGGTVNIHSGAYDSTECTVAENNGGKGFYLRNGNLTLAGGTFTADSSVEPGQVIYVAQAVVGDEVSAPKLIFSELPDRHSSWHANLVINDQDDAKAIALNNASCAVEVDASWIHEAAIYFKGASNVDATNHVVLGTATGEGNWTGSVVVSSIEEAPAVLRDGATLLVANAKNGETWTTAQAMVNEGKDVTLLGNAELNLEENQTANVDLNGNNIIVNGNGTFNGINSNSSKAATATLGADVTSGIEGGYEFSAWNEADKGGFYYVAIEELDENNARKVSYHKLTMAMTSIALRPSVAGLYYTSMIETDDVLAEYIDYAGIFIGATHTNQNNVTALEDRMRAAKEDDTITNLDGLLAYAKRNGFRAMVPDTDNWAQITSVMIKNILKKTTEDTTDNNTNGQMPVVGTPFVMFYFGDDETGVNVVLPSEDFKAYSVKKYLQSVADAVQNGDMTNDFDSTVTSMGPLDRLKQFCVDYGIYDLQEWNITEQSWVEPPKPEEA